ncbi:SpaA isopeptide-forming pilin-related protein [Eubacterium sp. 1001713B170207_170306_E7]|uniref:MSCRAMM family protein n=1 Tax=Eubacterium sp. 1001713B170207_170306_E7 TaxID=2787097 RepID=UPI00189886C6|nr:SpaA isopeptide-forming pilin-related protein [Eubacterium sp. 1001713B170207_170306_E7]
MKKKLFGVLTVLIILFSMVMPGAFAEESKTDSIQNQNIIENSAALSVIENNGIEQEKEITDEQENEENIQEEASPLSIMRNAPYYMVKHLTSSEDCKGVVVGPGINTGILRQQYVYTMNGIPAFCTEVEKPARVYEFDGWIDNESLANLPFYSYCAEYIKNGDEFYTLAVQWLVWEQVHNATSYPENDTVAENMEILKKAAEKAYKKPSFDNQTFDIEVGKSITIEDTNGVLGSEFNDFVGKITTADGISISKNGNKITISVAADTVSGDHNVKIEKYPDEYIGDSMYYQPIDTNGNHDFSAQAMRSFKFKDQLSCNFKVNVKSGRLQIQKKDNVDSNVVVKDAKFKVSKNADMSNPVGIYSTLDDGKTQVIENLLPGKYYVQEIYVPGAWVIDNTIKEVQVDVSSDATPLTVFEQTNNRKEGYVEIGKNDADTPNSDNTKPFTNTTESVNGGQFAVFYADGPMKDQEAPISHLISKRGEKVKSEVLYYYGDNFQYNTYYVQEIQAPNGYFHSDEKYYFTLTKPTETFSYTFKNLESLGSCVISKQDTVTGEENLGDATFEGAEYTLYAKEDIKAPWDPNTVLIKAGTPVHTFIMDKDGKTDAKDRLFLGEYYIKETKAPNGQTAAQEGSLENLTDQIKESPSYNLDTTEYPVSLKYNGQHEAVELVDNLSKDRVVSQAFQVIKINENDDSTTNLLEKAEFEVKLKSEFDKYYVEPADTSDVAAMKKAFAEAWAKTPIAKDKDNNDVPTLVTDSKGWAMTPRLPYGTYILHETVVPQWQLQTMDPYVFVVDKDSEDPKQWAVQTDETFEGRVKIVKKDAEYGNVVLKNTKFKIYDTDKKEYVRQKIGGQWTEVFQTEADGYTGFFETPQALTAGHYQIQEVEPPIDYIQYLGPTDALNVAIQERDGSSFEYDPVDKVGVFTINVVNKPTYGEIVLDKEDIDDPSIKVGNATFQLIANKDIYKPYQYITDENREEMIIYHKGDVITDRPNQWGGANGLYTTDINGHLEISNLPMGTLDTNGAEYKLVEVEVPDGYLNTDIDENGKVKEPISYGNFEKIITFLKDKDDIETEKYTYNLKVLEDYTKIQIHKVDANGYEAEHEQLLGGAELAIYKADGSGQPTGDPIAKWTSKEGEVEKIYRVLAPGNYILREEKAPDGYVKAPDVAFEVKETGAVQDVTIKNDYTKLNINKYEAGTQDQLAGAKLQIIQVTDGVETVMREWVTDGKIHQEIKLAPGDYILREVEAPAGYMKAADMPFTLKGDWVDGVIPEQNIQLEDDYTLVEISKVDLTGDDTAAELKGAGLALYKATEDGQAGEIAKIYNRETKQYEDARWTTDGSVKQLMGLEPGNYILREEKTPDDRYVKAEDRLITVDDKGYIASGNQAQQVDPMTNYWTEVSVTKKNAYDGSNLAGATLSIYPVDENNQITGDALRTWITTTETQVQKGIPAGRYVLREDAAPAGYLKAADVPFTLTAFKGQNTVTLEMTDEPFNMDFLKYSDMDDVIKRPVVKSIDGKLVGATMGIYDVDSFTYDPDTGTSDIPLISWNTSNRELIKYTGIFPTISTAIAQAKVVSSVDGPGLEVGKTYVYAEADRPSFVLILPEPVYFKVDVDAAGAPKFYYWTAGNEANPTVVDATQVQEKDADGNVTGTYQSFCDDQDGNNNYNDGTVEVLNRVEKDWANARISVSAVDADSNNNVPGAKLELYLKTVKQDVSPVSRLMLRATSFTPFADKVEEALDAVEYVLISEWTSGEQPQIEAAWWLSEGSELQIREAAPPEGYYQADNIDFVLENKNPEEPADMVAEIKVPHKKIPVLPSDNNGGTTEENSGSKVNDNAKTGFSSEGGMAMTLLVMAGAALAGTVIYRKKAK